MRIKIHFITLLFLSFFLILFFPKSALAANITLSGEVSDNSNNAIVGATVSVNDANNDSTITNSSGNYSLSIPQGTYNIQVTPPSGSGFTSAIALSQNISSDTTLNFVLTPAGTEILSGHVYDSQGNPVPNQKVILKTGGATTTTDASGNYSLTVSSGTYTLEVTSNHNSSSLNVPQYYDITANNFSLTQSEILDITIPAKKVSLHIQDNQSNSIGNVEVGAVSPFGTGSPDNLQGLTIANGVTNATGTSEYGTMSNTPPSTDASGNVTLWLFANNDSNTYKFTATPPNGSGFLTTTLSNQTVNTDENLSITLQNPVTLSGHVYDRFGNPVPNQKVILKTGGATATTDASGNYSLTVAPGTYTLEVTGNNNSSSLNVPQYYDITANNYTLTQNTTLDITIPVQKVSLHVQNAASSPVSSVQIQVVHPSGTGTPDNLQGLTIANGVTNATGTSEYGTMSNTPPSTDASGNVTLWVFADNGANTYKITGTPPTGSPYQTTTLANTPITVDTNLAMTLKQPVTLTGHVYDRSGNPIPNQSVILKSNGATTTTDASGSYTLNVSAGTYTLEVTGDNNNPTLNVPQYYDITANNYLLTQNTTLDITIPVQKVSIHVQDATSNPVSDIQIQAVSPFGTGSPDNLQGLTIANGVTNATGTSEYGTMSNTPPSTDASGNVTLWLFANNDSNTYKFTATPSSGSIYSTFTLNNISVTGDQTELVSLQYNHATPVTIATLSPTPYADGTYADPTTVTLSASAAAGYSVSDTYYTIDGGSQQTYSAPFTVTGAGNHTITYWSVDNSGVTEATNTKTFTITEAYSLTGTVYNDANQDGVQDNGEQGYAGAIVTLNTGQSTTTDSNGNYTFANVESGTYTETLTVPDGYTATTTNPVTFPLEANTTENFGIAQAAPTPVVAINAGGDTEGNFTADTDYNGGSTYATSASVDTSGVTNPAPTAVYQSVRYGNFTYTIPNLTANGTYTLQLHFSEPYWGTSQAGGGGVGSRIFNVSVNGTQALSDFDVYQAAGGANKAVMEQLPATADSNGNITVTFTSVVDNAMVNGIAVYTGTLPSPSPTPTPTPVSSLAISAGGQGSGSYVADTDYTGGTTYNTSATIDTSNVTDPAPQAVYQNVRYGNFSYTIPTYSPNTNYTVRLDFSEPYWNSAGQREFNVSINGAQVLNNFDVYQTAGGENKAVSETFNTTTDSNGLIKIQFNTVVDNAMVSGIQISQQ